ncbi:hypothetical protein EVJ58_g9149 [Rhodofomes roseus]|uniref:Uncharacterized protein n=1 Tax=Rhodofomes roseus TaxID=34475 RepID=A0A4Y9XV46_9APHY|nr:hypothetical protein EVJ58_g9149 [Rhodofomes roseus]
MHSRETLVCELGHEHASAVRTKLILGDLAVFMSSIAAIKIGGHADTEIGEKKDITLDKWAWLDGRCVRGS